MQKISADVDRLFDHYKHSNSQINTINIGNRRQKMSSIVKR